jgi:SH3 domain protein
LKIATTLFALGAALLLGAAAYAETLYISDELTVPLRSGPSNGHRILHAGLPSGTQMEVVSRDEEAGFTQIRTTRGTEGWIRSQYLVSEPIAKMRLAAAQREITRLKRDLDAQARRVNDLSATNLEQASSNEANTSRIQSLEAELAEIKQISANAVESHEQNLALQETNLRLRDEIDDLAEERNRLQSNGENQAIMIGAGLILLGLILGVIIKARPQRSAWS